MSSYRCKGCGQYFARPEYRRMGLSSVCSVSCFKAVMGHQGVQQPAQSTPSRDDPSPEVRGMVAVRDRGRCRYCGTSGDLHLHHINYRSQGIDHSPHNLVLLCGRHHRLVHSNKAYWQPILRAYIWRTYVEGQRAWLPRLEVELLRNRSLDSGEEPGDVSS